MPSGVIVVLRNRVANTMAKTERTEGMSVDLDKEHRAFLKRLRADLKNAATTMTPAEARYLVDVYYQRQEDRKRAANQTRAASEDDEPNTLVIWLADEFKALENVIKSAMDAYTDQFEVCRWAKSLYGVGPVLTAGIFAHIDIKRAPTAGSLWRLAGLDPTVKWKGAVETKSTIKNILCKSRDKTKVGDTSEVTQQEIMAVVAFFGRSVQTVTKDATTSKTGGSRPLNVANLTKAITRRPWNARLKTLLWRMADVQKKFSNKEQCFYGQLYQKYKANLVRKNINREFADAAKQVLEDRPGHKQKAVYEQGMLPDGHLDARALRWISKIFASHIHGVFYETTFGCPAPKPYAIACLEDHTHMIEIPNWPMKTG